MLFVDCSLKPQPQPVEIVEKYLCETTFYGINLRILWTELEMVVVEVDKVWFDEVSPIRANKGNETLPFYLRNQSYRTNSMHWDS